MSFYVLSDTQSRGNHVGWLGADELESVLDHLLQPVFIHGYRANAEGSKFLNPALKRFERKLFKSWFKLRDIPEFAEGNDNVLLILGLDTNVIDAIFPMANFLDRFRVKVVYLLDHFDPRWIRKEAVSALDHIFVIDPKLAEETYSVTSVPTTCLPYAVDILKFPPLNLGLRNIDVFGYGRVYEKFSACLKNYCNIQNKQSCFYLHSTFRGPSVSDLGEHRLIMNKLLSYSKINLCFEPSQTPRFRQQSPILYRWFESYAAGCTVVGKRPFNPGVADLIDWENSTIDIPDNSDDWIPFIHSIIQDDEMLKINAQRNYIQALRRHDWRHRIKQLLGLIDYPIPDALNNEIDYLQKSATEISA